MIDSCSTQEELNMEHDVGWKGFLSDDQRYADVINGFACGGCQIVKESDLQELDTQTGFLKATGFALSLRKTDAKEATGRKLRSKLGRKIWLRDMIRRVAFGINFAIIGIENQEIMDYSLPLRNLAYDTGEYEKQATRIRKNVRKTPQGLSRGEYLYGFRKDSKLHPVVTFVLYAGKEAWDGATALRELVDLTDIPMGLQEMVQDYKINLIEIRKLEDTSVFKTDVRQVFDFIRYSEDKEALKKLIETEPAYQSMEEDAFDVMVQYANAEELVGRKEEYEKEGKVDMCKAITEWLAEEREAGMQAGIQTGIQRGIQTGIQTGIQRGIQTGIDDKTRNVVINMLKRGMSDEDIIAIAECPQELIDELRSQRTRI